MNTIDKDRNLIRQAVYYRSGPDSCNSMYMGGMALASLMHALGTTLGNGDFEPVLLKANRKQLDNALDVCKNIIEYMQKHPMKICKCCGSILKAD